MSVPEWNRPLYLHFCHADLENSYKVLKSHSGILIPFLLTLVYIGE